MPAIQALGRRWHIGSDDLVVPGCLGSLFFAAWAGLLAGAQGRLDAGYYCTSAPFANFVSSLLALSAASCVAHGLLAWQSCLGGMLEERKRRWVSPLLYCLAILYGGILGLIIWGTALLVSQKVYTISGSRCSGEESAQWSAIARTVVFGSWAAFGLAFLVVLGIFNLFPSHSTPAAWVRRCTCLLCMCCSLECSSDKGVSASLSKNGSGGAHAKEAGESRTTQQHLGHTCHALFGREPLCMTDYVLGLVLLGTLQRILREEASSSVLTPGRDSGDSGSGERLSGCPDAEPAALEKAHRGVQIHANPCFCPSNPCLLDQEQEQAGNVMSSAELAGRPASSTVHPALKLPGIVSTACPSTGPATLRMLHQQHLKQQQELLQQQLQHNTPQKEQQQEFVQQQHQQELLQQQEQRELQQHQQQPELQHHHQQQRQQEEEEQQGRCHHQQQLHNHHHHHRDHRVKQQQQQQQQEPICSIHYQFNPSKENLENVTELVLQAAEHYKKYAFGPFGWPMYVWLHLTSARDGLCSLACGRGCRSLRDHDPSRFLPHVPCGGWWECLGLRRRLNREAAVRHPGIANEDLVMFCDCNQVAGLLPYVVALDHAKREVVLAIRGSMSAADIVTDTFWQPVDMHEALQGGGNEVPMPERMTRDGGSIEDIMACHRGVLMCSSAIKSHLEHHCVLEKAMSIARERETLARAQQPCGLASDDDYQLVLTGHSLGAGVASVLGLLLRPRYPGLRVWAHAPPGGLLSPKAAELTTHFCISVVHGKDMVPRLSTANLQHLVMDMMTAGAFCKLSKAEVLLRSLLGKRWRKEELFYGSWEEVPSSVKAVLEECQQAIQGSTAEQSWEWDLAASFMPPGRIVYLQDSKIPKSKTNRDPTRMDGEALPTRASPVSAKPQRELNRWQYDRRFKRHYTALWATAQAVIGNGLLVSRSMFVDHLPDKQISSLRSCYSNDV